MAIKISDDNYSQYLDQKGQLVAIDFWATWCGPCQRLTPIIEQVADEYEGRATVGKYNTEDNTELVDRFGIRSIPTVVFIKDGVEVDRLSGAVNKLKITDTIDKHL